MCIFELQEAALDFISITEEHTGANIALEIAKRIDSHTNINQLLYTHVTDNAANVLAAGKFLVQQFHELLESKNASELKALLNEEELDLDELQPGVRCIAHLFNLVVNNHVVEAVNVRELCNKVSKIVGLFNSSNKLQNALKQAQKDIGKKPLRLIQQNMTRWNSMCCMLRRFNQVCCAIIVLQET